MGLWLGGGGGGGGFVNGFECGGGLALVGDDAATGAGARALWLVGFVLANRAGVVAMLGCYRFRVEVAVGFFFAHDLKNLSSWQPVVDGYMAITGGNTYSLLIMRAAPQAPETQAHTLGFFTLFRHVFASPSCKG